jgi:hypothetical protein
LNEELNDIIDKKISIYDFKEELTYNNIKKDLKSIKKDIHHSDDKFIVDLINKIKDAENKYRTMFNAYEDYFTLLTKHGQVDPENVLKIKHVDEYRKQRDTYLNKIEKRSQNVFTMLEMLTKSIQDLSSRLPDNSKSSSVNRVTNIPNVDY